jgi:hypothetical protein
MRDLSWRGAVRSTESVEYMIRDQKWLIEMSPPESTSERNDRECNGIAALVKERTLNDIRA